MPAQRAQAANPIAYRIHALALKSLINSSLSYIEQEYANAIVIMTEMSAKKGKVINIAD
jgi:hypothetical protein